MLVLVLLFAPMIWTTRSKMRAREEAAVKEHVRDSLAEIARVDSAKAQQRRRDSALVARRPGDPPLTRGRNTVKPDPRFSRAGTAGSRATQPRGIP